MYSCCSKMVCNGCDYANFKNNSDYNCPFCREPMSSSDEEYKKRMMKRIKANDSAAMIEMGVKLYHEGDYDGALEYYTKAAELGDADAYCQLGFMYYEGDGVEEDEVKAVYHLEKASIGGHPHARHNLGCIEWGNGNMKRSVKHLIIAANLGCDESMKALWRHYSEGNITKEDLEATLRTHQAAINATKSPEREKVEEAIKNGCPIAAIKLKM